MIILAVVLAFVGIGLGVMVLLVRLIPPPNVHVARLRQLGAASGRTEAIEAAAGRRQARLGTWLQQAVERVGRMIPSQKPQARSKWPKLLLQAGYRRPNALLAFHGYRILLAVLVPGAVLLIAPHLIEWNGPRQLGAIFGSAAGGLFLPHWWLLQRIKWRQQQISDALPNALDLMVVCVEAGLGLDATIQRLAKEQQFTKQALSEEFQIVGQEMRAGRPRSEALLALKERVGSAEVSSLVVVLVQAEKMGTSIARSLRVHAEGLRTKRRQRAEERAAKIPVKMVFPLVLLIFPATLLVLLGPSYIIIFKALGAIPR